MADSIEFDSAVVGSTEVDLTVVGSTAGVAKPGKLVGQYQAVGALQWVGLSSAGTNLNFLQACEQHTSNAKQIQMRVREGTGNYSFFPKNKISDLVAKDRE